MPHNLPFLLLCNPDPRLSERSKHIPFFFSSVFSNELQETLPHDGLHVHVPEVQELGPLPTATQHAQPLKNAPPMTESLTGNRAMPAKVAGVPVPVSQIG